MVFWKENGAFILSMAILSVALTGAMSFYRSWDKGVNETQTAQIMQMVESSEFPENVYAAVTADDLKLRKKLKAFPVLQAAAKYRENGADDKAAALYKSIVDGKGYTSEYVDLALVLWAQVGGAPEIVTPKLKALSQNEKSPWQILALIEYAQVLAKQNQKDAAISVSYTHLTLPTILLV